MVARLLGPDGPEISCEQCFDQLDHYVELRMAAADADEELPGMHAHLHGCPACREDYESLAALVRADGGRPLPP
jgi:predicted anti-sigma-YlaC factor YlaD